MSFARSTARPSRSSRRTLLRTAALPLFAALCLGGLAHAQEKTTLKLGISGGVMEDVVQTVQKAAAREGLTIQPVVFSGHINANGPLNDGAVDAAAFQHQPYLNGQIKTFNYKLVSVGKTLSAPLGIYSTKYKSLDALPEKAVIGLPGDDTNRNRALLILQHYGVIKLRPTLDVSKGDNATLLDVVENPKKVQIKEIDSLILARSLSDVDAGAVITAQASQAGLLLARDAIAAEPPGGPYANVIAVHEKNRNAAWVPGLVRAFQSPEVRQLLETKYKGTLLPAF